MRAAGVSASTGIVSATASANAAFIRSLFMVSPFSPGIGRPLCGLYCTPIVTITYYKGSVTVTNANIAEVLATLRRVNRQWPTAVVGSYTETPFTVLIACILSLRTQDKTTDAASARLFKL